MKELIEFIVKNLVNDPENVTVESTEVYGVGAFLLAGVEILKMQ